jgi:hypothetical protein
MALLLPGAPRRSVSHFFRFFDRWALSQISAFDWWWRGFRDYFRRGTIRRLRVFCQAVDCRRKSAVVRVISMFKGQQATDGSDESCGNYRWLKKPATRQLVSALSGQTSALFHEPLL